MRFDFGETGMVENMFKEKVKLITRLCPPPPNNFIGTLASSLPPFSEINKKNSFP